VNEAFAVVPMAAMADLSIPREKINAYGGAGPEHPEREDQRLRWCLRGGAPHR
jgi:hypothetical protein